MSDDELILRRRKQNAERARLYRKRKKDREAMLSTSAVQSGEPVSENIVAPKLLHEKQLNAQRCRRYRQKRKWLNSDHPQEFLNDESPTQVKNRPLNETLVSKIKSKLIEGYSYRKIARHFGISPSTIVKYKKKFGPIPLKYLPRGKSLPPQKQSPEIQEKIVESVENSEVLETATFQTFPDESDTIMGEEIVSRALSHTDFQSRPQDEIEVEFINIIKENPFLYDARCEDNQNFSMRASLWEDLGQRYGWGSEVAKKRWTVLKTYYSQLKKQEATDYLATGVPKRLDDWKHYQHFRFFDDILKFKFPELRHCWEEIDKVYETQIQEPEVPLSSSFKSYHWVKFFDSLQAQIERVNIPLNGQEHLQTKIAQLVFRELQCEVESEPQPLLQYSHQSEPQLQVQYSHQSETYSQRQFAHQTEPHSPQQYEQQSDRYVDLQTDKCWDYQSEEILDTPLPISDSNDHDVNALVEAIKKCLEDEQSVRSSARLHNISRTTLHRYLKKVRGKYGNVKTVDHDILHNFVQECHQRVSPNMVFSPSVETQLVSYIVKCVDYYYGISIKELCELAYQLVKKLDIDYPPNWDENGIAGRLWYSKFIRRQPAFLVRSPEETTQQRSKGFCKSNVDQFFGKLDQLKSLYRFSPKNIYNMEEVGFSALVSKIGKTISLRRMRYFGKLEMDERRSMVTMTATVNAAGRCIPPFFLLPKNEMDPSILDFATLGSAGEPNDSGWMLKTEFLSYLRHFIEWVRPTAKSPALLLMGNQASILSVEVLDLASENNIYILSFPPHCSYRMQPLDVSIIGTLSKHYKSQCYNWQSNNYNRAFEIRDIPGVACKALDLAVGPEPIKNGFEATGIYPFNPNIYTDEDFEYEAQQQVVEVAVEAVLDEEEQRRIIIDPTFYSESGLLRPDTEPSTSRRGSL